MKKIFVLFTVLPSLLSSFAQNVGIGTNTPSEKLQVAGNIKADTAKLNDIRLETNAGEGKVLTSDANGNGSWQNKSTALNNSGNVGYGVWGDCATSGNLGEYQPVADTATNAYDYFGLSVSVSGNFAIVGKPLEKVGANAAQGSASMYVNNGNGWVLLQKLTDTAGAANDQFGNSVSISGNYAVVGAPGSDMTNINQGSASIYQYNGSEWVLVIKTTRFLGGANEGFGTSVSISGNRIIVGTPGPASTARGYAVMLQLADNGSFSLYQPLPNPTGLIGQGFGNTVSISGNFAIVGAENADTAKGNAFLYQFNGSSWSFIQKLTATERQFNERFGNSVSISGNYAIVGEFHDGTATNPNVGAAHIYGYKNNSWSLIKTLYNPNDSTGHLFGSSVSISGDYIIVGSSDGGELGAAIIYQRISTIWRKLQYVTDPRGESGDYFGYSSCIDAASKHFIIGAPYSESAAGQVIFGKVN